MDGSSKHGKDQTEGNWYVYRFKYEDIAYLRPIDSPYVLVTLCVGIARVGFVVEVKVCEYRDRHARHAVVAEYPKGRSLYLFEAAAKVFEISHDWEAFCVDNPEIPEAVERLKMEVLL